jgi:hypothetical protein
MTFINEREVNNVLVNPKLLVICRNNLPAPAQKTMEAYNNITGAITNLSGGNNVATLPGNYYYLVEFYHAQNISVTTGTIGSKTLNFKQSLDSGYSCCSFELLSTSTLTINRTDSTIPHEWIVIYAVSM